MINKETAKTIAKYTMPFGGYTWDLTEKAINKVYKSSVTELEEEMKKEEFIHKLKMQQAKIEQELAISERIRTAYKVEIEEYFDGKGKGSVGVDVSGEGVNVGLKGSGQKVTSRVIRFIGFQVGAGGVEEFEEIEEESSEPNFVLK